MNPRTRRFLITLVIVLIALGAGYWRNTSVRVNATHELRQMHGSIAEYLLAHDFRWPQPGDKDASTWWRTDGADRMSGDFEVAQFDARPNMAFYDPKTPWVTYTAGDGSRYQMLPDGRIEVSASP